MGAALRDYNGPRDFNDFGPPPPPRDFGPPPPPRDFSPPPPPRDFGPPPPPRDFGPPPPPRDFGYGEEVRIRSLSPPPGYFGPRGPPITHYNRDPPPPPPPIDASPQLLPRYGSPERRPSPARRYGPPRDLTPPRRYISPAREPSPPWRPFISGNGANPYSGPPGRYGDAPYNYRDESPGRWQYRSDPYDSDEDRRRFDEETREQLRFSRSRVRRRPVATGYSGGWY